MSRDLHNLTPAQHNRLAREVMRKQAALSLRVAAVFLLLLFGLPLVNALMPGLAKTPVAGFPLSWLFLGILFFPITWGLSWYFVNQSDRLEDECTDWRRILGIRAGEPIEPKGVGDVKPAFVKTDLGGEAE